MEQYVIWDNEVPLPYLLDSKMCSECPNTCRDGVSDRRQSLKLARKEKKVGRQGMIHVHHKHRITD